MEAGGEQEGLGLTRKKGRGKHKERVGIILSLPTHTYCMITRSMSEFSFQTNDYHISQVQCAA